MAKQELFFYFDYISPYAYLAWKRVIDFAEKHSLILKPEPVLFGALLTRWETRGPAEIPPKREYVFKDVLRSAAYYNIPINFPPAHPFNPLAALRATCLMEKHPEYCKFIDIVFSHCWEAGKDISGPETIVNILSGFGIENGLEKINSAEIKETLREKTDKAIESGIFGVPSLVIENEIFWGNDRFEFLENYLHGKDPVTPEKMEQLLKLPRDVDRRQVTQSK